MRDFSIGEMACDAQNLFVGKIKQPYGNSQYVVELGKEPYRPITQFIYNVENLLTLSQAMKQHSPFAMVWKQYQYRLHNFPYAPPPSLPFTTTPCSRTK